MESLLWIVEFVKLFENLLNRKVIKYSLVDEHNYHDILA